MTGGRLSWRFGSSTNTLPPRPPRVSRKPSRAQPRYDARHGVRVARREVALVACKRRRAPSARQIFREARCHDLCLVDDLCIRWQGADEGVADEGVVGAAEDDALRDAA